MRKRLSLGLFVCLVWVQEKQESGSRSSVFFFSRRKVCLFQGARVASSRCTGKSVCFTCVLILSRVCFSAVAERVGLVQREQRLHVVLLALHFVRSFQDTRLHHRLRPAGGRGHDRQVWVCALPADRSFYARPRAYNSQWMTCSLFFFHSLLNHLDASLLIIDASRS